MSEILRYARLQDYFDQFNKGTFASKFRQDVPYNSNSQKIIKSAMNNGFQLYEFSGKNPRVILIGITHKTGDIDQTDRLETILKESLENRDILMVEGRGPSEVIYEHYHRKDFISRLKDIMLKKEIRTIFNDSNSFIGDFILASQALKGFTQYTQDTKKDNSTIQPFSGTDIVDPNYVVAVKKYINALDIRDRNFSEHLGTGIIPFINGTTDNYKKLAPDGSIFQVFGMLHVLNGVVQEQLENAKIDYITLIPREPTPN